MQDALPLDATIDLNGLVDLPASQTLVLTVNNRLARRLTLELAERLRLQRQVSELPRILPLTAWLADAAHTLTFLQEDAPKFRLSAFASLQLWVDVIEAEEAERPLMDVHQAGRLAIDADTLMQEWALSVPGAAATDDYLGFERWRKRYRARLRQLDAQDANRGYEDVLDAMRQGILALPAHVVMAGFTEVSPRFARLSDLIHASGASVYHFEADARAPALPVRVPCPDPAAEWRAAVRWARAQLERHPEGRYAIITSQLETQAPFARRVLHEILDEAGFAYNVAVGRPLSAWPAVHAALAWFDVLDVHAERRACPPALAGAALLAGHHAGESAAGALALADVRWRRQALLHVTETAWTQALGAGPALQSGWHQAVAIWREPHARGESADVWAAIMRRALSALGFPGRSNDSVTFQVVEAFSDLLDTFAALTPVARGLSGASAIALLRQLAHATPFQPQRDPRARLDVLGMLEAEGGHWDGAWILGLTDDVLPASPKPNPLVPLVVLRQAGAPRATPARERMWAQHMFDALCRVAPDVRVSHALHEGEKELRPSPLIAAFEQAAADSGLPASSQHMAAAPSQHTAAPSAAPSQHTPPSESVTLESLRDEQGPPLQADTVTTGGTDVLDTQARNPLWAFVRHRLGARALLPYAEVASVNVRGQFLHRALELAWAELSGQDALHARMAAHALDEVLQPSIARAAEEWLLSYPDVLADLERARAHTLLTRWFELEAQRPPFQVAQVEGKLNWTRGNLSLTARLDRMDRLDDGLMIIDYKTGGGTQSVESDWSRDRPVNLQLPFYASVIAGEDERVTGLVLAQVHARRIVALGLADMDTGFDGVKALAQSKYFEGITWDAAVTRWREAIEALADEFARGHAANTVWRASDLKYCDAMPFLRLHLEDDDE